MCKASDDFFELFAPIMEIETINESEWKVMAFISGALILDASWLDLILRQPDRFDLQDYLDGHFEEANLVPSASC